MTTQPTQPLVIVNQVFEALSDGIERILGSTAKEILVGTGQDELRQAIAADLVDIIPLVGDAANVLRIQDASRKGGDFPRKRISGQLVDFIGGAIPVIGDIFDALTPTNTLSWLEAHGISPTDAQTVFETLRKEFGLQQGGGRA